MKIQKDEFIKPSSSKKKKIQQTHYHKEIYKSSNRMWAKQDYLNKKMVGFLFFLSC